MDRAIVRDNRDPSKKGRLKVQIPRLTGKGSTDWIWPSVSSGFLVLPNPGDQVWVDYEGGDTNFPVWVGKTQVTKQYKNDAGKGVGDVSQILERLTDIEKKLKEMDTSLKALGKRVKSIEQRLH
jgi:hypothetical protein